MARKATEKDNITAQEAIPEPEAIDKDQQADTPKQHKKADANKQKLMDAFSKWNVDVLYQTDDGTCFFGKNMADNHAKKIGSNVNCYRRSEVI